MLIFNAVDQIYGLTLELILKWSEHHIMIKALLLDLDGTLLDDRAAMMAATKAFFLAHEKVLSGETFDEFFQRWCSSADKCWRRFLSGELSFEGQRRDRAYWR